MADTFTAKLGLRQYDASLFYDVAKFSADNLLIDNAFGTVICTSTTRPSTGLYNGMTLWETDTRRFVVRVSGAWVPVPQPAIIADQTARTAITTPYDGMIIYRQDRDWIEIYDGAAWRVQGVAKCTTTSDRDTAITSPYDGLIAITTTDGLAWQRFGGAWMAFPRRIGGEYRANAVQTLATGATKLTFPTTLFGSSGITVTGNNTFRVPVDGVYAMTGFCKIDFPTASSASLSIGGTTYASPMYSGDDFSSATTDVSNNAVRYLNANTDVCVYVYNNDTSRNTAFASRPAEFAIWKVA